LVRRRPRSSARTTEGRVKTALDDREWELLLRRIRNEACTPFLGAGASAHILPSGAELAARWANDVQYPLPERGDLARVAQYIAITGDPLEPKELVSQMCTSVDLAEALQPDDSYDIISGLDLPIYITTNYDDLLLHALRNRRKEPQVLLCPWNPTAKEHVGETYNYNPTHRKPAVYYLHGTAHEPGSIVLTEDDYLDFIIWVTSDWKEQANVSHIAPVLKRALARNSLLFIGYSQNDWNFRVLLRCIRQTGASLGALNIAVQLSPLTDDATEVDQERVSSYLTKYFSGIHSKPVKIYWGTANEFLRELQARMAETEHR
jgi:hypothetical protein